MAFVGIQGKRISGDEVRNANVAAIASVANILKSSLGPQGLDKMIVDDIGDVTISNDGATILKKLEITHPAAKIMVDLSDLQDQEVGDGTTSVVLLAAELLRNANELVKVNIHPTSVISGYKLAMKECVRYIESNFAAKVDSLGPDILQSVAKTSISSKFVGAVRDSFSKMIVDAVVSIKMVNDMGVVKYPVSSINILKTHGRSIKESVLVSGYALKTSRAAQGMPTIVKNAKVALLDFNLRQHRMQMGIQVHIENPDELEKIRLKEKDIVRSKIQKIIAAGANVVLSTEGIDDMSLKYFVEAGILALRRVDLKDMRRIEKLTGGNIVSTLATLDGDEKFDSAWLGYSGEVEETRVGDWDYVFFRNCKGSKSTTMILRGANEFMLDELERSIHDSLCCVSRVLESSTVCVGGGAVECALSIYLEDFARTLGSREQLAVSKFAESLLVIPKTLAINAAQDANELVAKLRACHSKAQSSGEGDVKNYKWYGLDLIEGKLQNCLANGVVEPIRGKCRAIRFATEAAVTILRIDDFIENAPETSKPPHDCA